MGCIGKDEFIIFFVDIEFEIVNLIVEKVCNGVEKLCFVSLKNGIKLFVIMFVLGIVKYEEGNDFNYLVWKVLLVVVKVKLLG